MADVISLCGKKLASSSRDDAIAFVEGLLESIKTMEFDIAQVVVAVKFSTKDTDLFTHSRLNLGTLEALGMLTLTEKLVLQELTQ